MEQLQKLKMANDNKKKIGFVHPNQADRNIEYAMQPEATDNETEKEYEKLSLELDQLRAHLTQLKNRKTQIQLNNDQVGGWANRVGKKLADQLDDHSLAHKNAPLIQQFRNIGTMVH